MITGVIRNHFHSKDLGYLYGEIQMAVFVRSFQYQS